MSAHAERPAEQMADDLLQRARHLAVIARSGQAVAETGESGKDYDLVSTAPGVEILADAETSGLVEVSEQVVAQDETVWAASLPHGAYQVIETSILLTPRAKFNEQGQIIDSEPWLSVPAKSVLEIRGSNGTYWRNDQRP